MELQTRKTAYIEGFLYSEVLDCFRKGTAIIYINDIIAKMIERFTEKWSNAYKKGGL